MSPRASLPGADELFRRTQDKETREESDDISITSQEDMSSAQTSPTPRRRLPKHEEKITFYCTPDELVRVERARLALRADHGIAADRGRIVRAALEEILGEFEARGINSSLVRRLQDEE